ncbi:MAG TPA: phosphate/phosphite/phosphonate ABC transporter substrate-binding protein [Candidatus Binatia bacterium]|nr:phosphate/phosphite/phosphonate ABC transporter substrate-binding protein [Candidatus Binatia bacterium]
MKHLRFLAVLVAIMMFAVACTSGGDASPGTDESEAPSGPEAWPDELVMGFVPSREADTLVEDIDAMTAALAAALSEQAGRDITVEGFVPSDYTGLVTAMESGQAHIGAFGPFSLLQARDRAGAEIILQSERFGSATYHTQFMTNDPDKYCDDEPVVVDEETGWMNCNGTADADEGPVAEEKIAEIEAGTTVSFVEQASASGYIFPATIFLNNGIDPETDLDAIFAGGHDASVVAVCDGDAEVGVAFDDARGAAETECDIAENVIVFAYGPEIPNDGWAVAGDLPDDLKEAIKQALLDYAGTEEGQATLNEIYEIDNLVEADLDAFTIVEDAARELGIEGD